MDLEENLFGGSGLHSMGAGQELMLCFCENGDEP